MLEVLTLDSNGINLLASSFVTTLILVRSLLLLKQEKIAFSSFLGVKYIIICTELDYSIGGNYLFTSQLYTF